MTDKIDIVAQFNKPLDPEVSKRETAARNKEYMDKFNKIIGIKESSRKWSEERRKKFSDKQKERAKNSLSRKYIKEVEEQVDFDRNKALIKLTVQFESFLEVCDNYKEMRDEVKDLKNRLKELEDILEVKTKIIVKTLRLFDSLKDKCTEDEFNYFNDIINKMKELL